MKNNNKADELLDRFNQLKSNRSVWETLWERVDSYMSPIKSNATNRRYSSLPAEKRNQLAHAMMGLGTNSASEWFKLDFPDYDTSNDSLAKDYLYDVTQIIHFYLRQSNFYETDLQAKLDRIDFGTAGCLIEENTNPDNPDQFFFTPLNPRDAVFDINEQGRIDTVHLTPNYSYRQLVLRFGEENLPEKLVKRAKDQMTKPANVRMVITPRLERDKSKRNATNKPFASYWIDVEDRVIFHEGGFDEFPCPVSPWQQKAGEIYGIGPTIEALDDIAILNKYIVLSLKAKDRQVNPAMAFTNTLLSAPAIEPGERMLLRKMEDMPRPIYTGENIAASDSEIQERKEAINNIYFSDLVMLQDVGYNRTRAETQIKDADRQRVLSSLLTRQQSYYEQVIDRVLGILSRKKIIPPLPDHLEGAKVKPVFTNPLAQKYNELKVDALNKMIMALTPLAQMGIPVLEHIKTDEIIGDAAEIFGVDPTWVKSKKEIKEQNAAAAQAQQQQMMLSQGTDLLNSMADAEAKTANTGGMVNDIMSGGLI